MTALQEALPRLERLNVHPAVISVDSPAALTDLRRDCRVTYPLLSDEKRETIRAWGLLNARERGGIAVPSMWVVDESGTIVFRSLDRCEARADLETVLQFLEQLRRDAGSRLENQQRRVPFPGLWDMLAAIPRLLFGKK